MADETCVFHPGQKAVATCEKCSKAYCPVCLINSEGHTFCRSCAEEAPKTPGSMADLDHLLAKSPVGKADPDDDPLGIFAGNKEVGVPRPSPVSPAESPSTPDEVRPSPATPPSRAVPPGMSAPVDVLPSRGMSAFGLEQQRRDASPLVVFWWTIEKALKPVVQATRLPVPALLGIAAVLVLVILLVSVILWVNRPSLKTLGSVPAVHLVKVPVNQVGELDITQYLEIENKLREMGFASLLQMTISQAPSANFFSVYTKESAGVYAEIIKLPSVLAPKVAFITVFNNGVWCSTNGFDGKDALEEFLISTHHPRDASDALYVKHMQKVEQLKRQSGWVPARMGESRYVAAITDLFRWYIALKKIPGYKASFELWH